MYQINLKSIEFLRSNFEVNDFFSKNRSVCTPQTEEQKQKGSMACTHESIRMAFCKVIVSNT